MAKVIRVMSPVQTSPVEQYTSTKTQVVDAPEAVAEDQAEVGPEFPPLMAGDCVFFCKGNSFGSVVWPALIKHVNANDTLDLVVFDAGGIMQRSVAAVALLVRPFARGVDRIAFAVAGLHTSFVFKPVVHRGRRALRGHNAGCLMTGRVVGCRCPCSLASAMESAHYPGCRTGFALP